MKINLIANMNGVLIGLCYDGVKEISVGREVGNTIAALAADGLSRRHARIFEKEGAWFLEDLGSTNGTYRQGERITEPVKLAVRDMLQFGKFEISVDEIAEGTVVAPAPVAAAPAPAPAPAPVAAQPPVAPRP